MFKIASLFFLLNGIISQDCPICEIPNSRQEATQTQGVTRLICNDKYILNGNEFFGFINGATMTPGSCQPLKCLIPGIQNQQATLKVNDQTVIPGAYVSIFDSIVVDCTVSHNFVKTVKPSYDQETKSCNVSTNDLTCVSDVISVQCNDIISSNSFDSLAFQIASLTDDQLKINTGKIYQVLKAVKRDKYKIQVVHIKGLQNIEINNPNDIQILMIRENYIYKSEREKNKEWTLRNLRERYHETGPFGKIGNDGRNGNGEARPPIQKIRFWKNKLYCNAHVSVINTIRQLLNLSDISGILSSLQKT
ncbi:hypothetical protein A3Q56_01018 [Intoshia linei]|uniref:Sushi domain-containing protein n=1 Tax=Intoshia linei TaxID=1819745 RepID=A0A177BC54_9BILA|nr:hypothetical protein A3Q56_01018 [Intoshia linei]